MPDLYSTESTIEYIRRVRLCTVRDLEHPERRRKIGRSMLVRGQKSQSQFLPASSNLTCHKFPCYRFSQGQEIGHEECDAVSRAANIIRLIFHLLNATDSGAIALVHERSADCRIGDGIPKIKSVAKLKSKEREALQAMMSVQSWA